MCELQCLYSCLYCAETKWWKCKHVIIITSVSSWGLNSLLFWYNTWATLWLTIYMQEGQQFIAGGLDNWISTKNCRKIAFKQIWRVEYPSSGYRPQEPSCSGVFSWYHFWVIFVRLHNFSDNLKQNFLNFIITLLLILLNTEMATTYRKAGMKGSSIDISFASSVLLTVLISLEVTTNTYPFRVANNPAEMSQVTREWNNGM